MKTFLSKHLTNTLQHLGAALLLLSMATSAFAQDNPSLKPYSADYRFFYGSKDVGGSVISLKQEPNSWLLHAETTPEGLAALIKSGTLVEDTQFVIQDDKIVPVYYKSETHDTKLTFSGRKPTVKVEEQINFDWQNNTATYFYEGKNKTMQMPEGSVTRQALSMALAYHFAGKGNAEVGDKVSLLFPDRQKNKEYTFEVKRHVILTTKAGKFDSYYVERDDGKRITAFWLATELNFQPVRFEKYKKGETKISSEITAIRWLD